MVLEPSVMDAWHCAMLSLCFCQSCAPRDKADAPLLWLGGLREQPLLDSAFHPAVSQPVPLAGEP